MLIEELSPFFVRPIELSRYESEATQQHRPRSIQEQLLMTPDGCSWDKRKNFALQFRPGGLHFRRTGWHDGARQQLLTALSGQHAAATAVYPVLRRIPQDLLVDLLMHALKTTGPRGEERVDTTKRQPDPQHDHRRRHGYDSE